jgi:hypothetical protein
MVIGGPGRANQDKLSIARARQLAQKEDMMSKHLRNTTKLTLEQIDQAPTDDLRYAAAYGILRGYFEAVYNEVQHTLSAEQREQIKTVLGQLKKLVQE